MPACPRKEIVDPDVVGVYHCYSRCVRRGHLCGFDDYAGIDYSHRLEWFDVRIRQLQQVFLMDMFSYAFLDNHFHTIVRNRPDLVAKLSDREVARRSLLLSPNWMPEDDQLPEPSKEQIDRVLADPPHVQAWRERLSSLSWYMRYLKEVIARRANAEDDVTGCFWEARFNSVRLFDALAVMLCSVYVDLNEVRAGIAETLEQSTHSSISQRIDSWQADRQRKSKASGKRAWQLPNRSKYEPAPTWLAPINERCHNGTRSGTMTEEVPRPGAPRPSNSGFLPMTVEQYFQLCDWVGRCVRQDKRGAIPASLAPILERLTRDVDVFLHAAKNFGRLFKRFCGSPDRIRSQRREQGARNVHGLTTVDRLYPAEA